MSESRDWRKKYAEERGSVLARTQSSTTSSTWLVEEVELFAGHTTLWNSLYALLTLLFWAMELGWIARRRFTLSSPVSGLHFAHGDHENVHLTIDILTSLSLLLLSGTTIQVYFRRNYSFAGSALFATFYATSLGLLIYGLVERQTCAKDTLACGLVSALICIEVGLLGCVVTLEQIRPLNASLIETEVERQKRHKQEGVAKRQSWPYMGTGPNATGNSNKSPTNEGQVAKPN